MEDHTLVQGEIITKWQKNIDKLKKSFSPEPLGQFQRNMAKDISNYSILKKINGF